MTTDATPGEEEEGGVSSLAIFAIIALILAVAALIVPNWMRARAQGRGTSCKSNLKNIGTAFEMYSTDWSGSYPATLEQLTPRYLKTIPECSAAGEVTYRSTRSVAYNSPGFEDYYFIWCAGDAHHPAGLPWGYPQYDGISGLLER